jgi:toxin ParE1/3/4
MAKYRFTNKAIDDLNQIWDYTCEQWSDAQAEKYYQMIIEGCEDIAVSPRLGRNYSEIAQDLKGYKIGRHIIFYRKEELNELTVIRILHDQMDLKRRIKEK